MDLAIIFDGWPHDERDEVNNIRKIVGIDGRVKLQIRLRDGVIQWELEGRPDGRRPYGFESVLAYCRVLLERSPQPRRRLDKSMLDELEAELLAVTKRRLVLLKIGDYSRGLKDAVHALGVLQILRKCARDKEAAFQSDRYRPLITADKARAEALLEVQREQMQGAIQALNNGIHEIEEFFQHYGIESQISKSQERQALVDLRRSLRERYSIPLTDDELLETLKAEQQVAIEQEDFEMAARLRDKINLLLEKLGKTV